MIQGSPPPPPRADISQTRTGAGSARLGVGYVSGPRTGRLGTGPVGCFIQRLAVCDGSSPVRHEWRLGGRPAREREGAAHIHSVRCMSRTGGRGGSRDGGGGGHGPGTGGRRGSRTGDRGEEGVTDRGPGGGGGHGPGTGGRRGSRTGDRGEEGVTDRGPGGGGGHGPETGAAAGTDRRLMTPQTNCVPKFSFSL